MLSGGGSAEAELRGGVAGDRALLPGKGQGHRLRSRPDAGP